MRRFSWQLPVAALLLVLLATLATFQYRWLGEVSRAESERMRASPKSRTTIACREIGWLFSDWTPRPHPLTSWMSPA